MVLIKTQEMIIKEKYQLRKLEKSLYWKILCNTHVIKTHMV